MFLTGASSLVRDTETSNSGTKGKRSYQGHSDSVKLPGILLGEEGFAKLFFQRTSWTVHDLGGGVLTRTTDSVMGDCLMPLAE